MLSRTGTLIFRAPTWAGVALYVRDRALVEGIS